MHEVAKVLEFASAGHSNPVTALYQAGVLNMALSLDNTVLFPDSHCRWMCNASLLPLLQKVRVFSCLENPRDCGAWWAAIYGVAQSRTQLK